MCQGDCIRIPAARSGLSLRFRQLLRFRPGRQLAIAPARREHADRQVDDRQDAADDEQHVARQAQPLDHAHRRLLEERRLAACQ